MRIESCSQWQLVKEREKVESDRALALKWDLDEAIKENKAHLARIKELEGVNAILQSKTM